MRLASIWLLVIMGLAGIVAPSNGPLSLKVSAQSADAPLGGGFAGNNKDPIDIQADELEIRQTENLAIFTGNVDVVQGNLRLRSAKLIVKYHMVGKGENKKREIKRLDATGGVIVTSDSQSATGDWATMDTTTNIIVMGDEVVITQNGNVIRGNKVLVDLNTGYSRIISNEKKGGRVRALFKPKKK